MPKEHKLHSPQIEISSNNSNSNNLCKSSPTHLGFSACPGVVDIRDNTENWKYLKGRQNGKFFTFQPSLSGRWKGVCQVAKHNLSHPEVTPVIYLDTAGDEDDAGAGGRPDGERYGQQNQQQLLQNIHISRDSTCVVSLPQWSPHRGVSPRTRCYLPWSSRGTEPSLCGSSRPWNGSLSSVCTPLLECSHSHHG